MSTKNNSSKFVSPVQSAIVSPTQDHYLRPYVKTIPPIYYINYSTQPSKTLRNKFEDWLGVKQYDYYDENQINSLADIIYKYPDVFTGLFKGASSNTDESLSRTISAGKETFGLILNNVKLGLTGHIWQLLGAFGEDMDIVANPVKGAIIEGFNLKGHTGRTAWEGVVNATKNRHNYDYDFEFGEGNGWGFVEGVTELVAETLSDPISLAELVLTFGIDNVAGATLKNVSKSMADDIGVQLSNKEVKRAIKNGMLKAITSGEDDALEKTFTNIFEASLRNDNSKTLKILKESKDILLPHIEFEAGVHEAAETLAKKLVSGLDDSLSFKVVKGLSTTKEAVKTIDEAILKASLYSTVPYAYPVKEVLKGGVKAGWDEVKKLFTNKVTKELDKVNYTDVAGKPVVNFKAVLDDTYKNTIAGEEGKLLKHLDDIEDVPHTTVVHIVKTLLEPDVKTLREILLNKKKINADTIKKLTESIISRYSAQGVKTFDDFIDLLEQINKKLDDDIADTVALFKETKVMSELTDASDALKQDSVFKKIQHILDENAFVEDVEDTFKKALKHPLIENTATVAYNYFKYLDNIGLPPIAYTYNAPGANKVFESIVDNIINNALEKSDNFLLNAYNNLVQQALSNVKTPVLDELNKYAAELYKTYIDLSNNGIDQNIIIQELYNKLNNFYNNLSIKDSILNTYNENYAYTLYLYNETLGLKDTLNINPFSVNLNKAKENFSKVLGVVKKLAEVTKLTPEQVTEETVELTKKLKNVNSIFNISVGENRLPQDIVHILNISNPEEKDIVLSAYNSFVEFVNKGINNYNDYIAYVAAWEDLYSNTIKYGLEDMRKSLVDVAPTDLSTVLKIQSGEILYSLEQNQAAYIYGQIEGIPINQAIEKIASKDDAFGNFINSVIDASEKGMDRNIAQNVLKAAKAYTDYVNFVKHFESLDIEPTLKQAIRSVMHSSEFKHELFYRDFDKWFNRLIEKIEVFYNESNVAKNAYSLDNLSDKLNLPNKSHTVIDDVLKNSIISKEDKDIAKILKSYEDEGRRILFWDTEGSGLSTSRNRIYEMSLVEHDSTVWNKTTNEITGNSKNYKISYDPKGKQIVSPESHVLEVLFPEANNYETRLDLFKKRYGNGGDAVLTEGQMYVDFIKDLRDYTIRDGVAPVIAGHNINAYDKALIIQRMYDLGIPAKDIAWFKELEFVDTLELKRKADGFMVMSNEVKNSLREILGNYNATLSAHARGNVHKIMDPDVRGLKQALERLQKTNICDRFGASDKVLRAFKYFKESLDEALKNSAKRFNITPSIMQDTIMSKRNLKATVDLITTRKTFTELLEEGVPEHVLTNIIKNSEDLKIFFKTVLNLDSDEALTEFLTSNPNYTKLFYRNVEYMYGASYKKLIDFDAITTYFNIPEYLPRDIAEELTKATKEMSQYSKRVGNKSYIIGKKTIVNTFEYSDEAIKSARETLALYKEAFPEDVVLRYLITNEEDFATTWAALAYITKRHNIKELTKNMPLEQVLKITGASQEIVNTILHKKYTFVGDESLAIKEARLQELVSRDVENTLEEVTWYSEIQERLLNLEDRQDVEMFGLGLSAHDMYNTSKQVRYNAMKGTNKFVNALAKFRDVFMEVDTKHKTNYDKLRFFKDMLIKHADKSYYNMLNQIASFSSDDLVKFMAYNQPVIEFGLTSKESIELYQKFVSNIDNYEKAGVRLITTENRLYIVLDSNVHKVEKLLDGADNFNSTKVILNGKELDYVPELKRTFDKLDVGIFNSVELKEALEELTIAENELNSTMERLTRGASKGSDLEVLTRQAYETLYEQYPDEVKKLLPAKETLLHENNFVGYKFNFTNLGDSVSRRAKIPYTEIDPYRLTATHSLDIVRRAREEDLMLDFMFSKDNSLKTIFENNFTGNPQKLVDILKSSPELKVAALVQNEKLIGKGVHGTGIQVVELPVKNVAQLEKAIFEHNAVLIDSSTFSNIFQKVNTSLYTDTELKAIGRITYLYKFGYLARLGTIMRNAIDSAVKTMISTEHPIATIKNLLQANGEINKYSEDLKNILGLDLIDIQKLEAHGIDVDAFVKSYNGKNKINAIKLLQEYDLAMDDILNMDKAARFKRENVEFYFKHMNTNLDYETFKTLHIYLNEGSGGIIETWEQYCKDIHKERIKDMSKITNYSISKFDEFWGSFVHMTNKIMTPMEKVEQINRVAQLMTMQEFGVLNKFKVFGSITDTHFDYAVKTDKEKFAELLMPFYTFTKRNAIYWTDKVSQNPWLARLFSDYLKEAWGLDELDSEEINSNKSLNAFMTTGNIRFSGNKVLKVSPSFMDTFNMYAQPLQFAENKLWTPAQTMLNYVVDDDTLSTLLGTYQMNNSEDNNMVKDVLTDLVPIYGAFNSSKKASDTYYERTGSLLMKYLPDIFGAIKQKEAYNSSSYSRGYSKKLPHIKKQYNKKRYTKRYYGKRKYYGKKQYNRKYALKAKPFKFKNYKFKVPNTYPKYNTLYNTPYSTRFQSRPIYNNLRGGRYYIPRNTYYNLYTKQGASRLKQMGTPTTAQNLKAKLITMQRYYNR